MSLANKIKWTTKYRIGGKLTFQTAFRIGSGREGESGSDLGVLLAPDGTPILPGSTLKGKFRATGEKLSHILNMSACLLDVKTSDVKCVSDIDYYRSQNKQCKLGDKNAVDRYRWAGQHTCDICKLFGSPMLASHIFFHDGDIGSWANVIERRDGVVIDRDSEKAVDGLKYDFDVVPAGTWFDIRIDLENPEDREIALVAAVVAEWEQGTMLGGGVSRGLGLAKLSDIKIEKVDFTDPSSFIPYLVKQQMQEVPWNTWQTTLEEVATECHLENDELVDEEGSEC